MSDNVYLHEAPPVPEIRIRSEYRWFTITTTFASGVVVGMALCGIWRVLP